MRGWLRALVLACAVPVTMLAQAGAPGVMKAAEVQKVLPATVFFRGLSAPVQARNSGGVVPLEIGGQRLVPGAYGCGFIAGDKFIVQDIGAHDLFTTSSTKDAGLKRPTPLQVLSGPNAGEYRL